jgi:regulatory protein
MKGAAGEMVRVHLSDGSFFLLHQEVFERAGLFAGTQLDSETKSQLLERSERVRARVQALRLLARGAHTRRGLARKLATRGFGRDAIGYAVARMSQLGYLDDSSFAQLWVRARLSSGKDGATALYRGLLSRGVPRTLAQEVIDDMYPHDEEVRHARQLSEGLSRRAAARRLAGRGFRSRAIAAVIRDIPETARELKAD